MPAYLNYHFYHIGLSGFVKGLMLACVMPAPLLACHHRRHFCHSEPLKHLDLENVADTLHQWISSVRASVKLSAVPGWAVVR